jgi:hypothetical protein
MSASYLCAHPNLVQVDYLAQRHDKTDRHTSRQAGVSLAMLRFKVGSKIPSYPPWRDRLSRLLFRAA